MEKKRSWFLASAHLSSSFRCSCAPLWAPFSVLFWLVGASVAFNECQWELLHNSYHVVMSWCRSAACLLILSTFFFFSSQASCVLFVFIGAEAERSCGEFCTPYLTQGNCNLSWEEGVSLGDLPLNNYSHDKAINQDAPLPAHLLSCFGEDCWFIWPDALSPMARKPVVALPCQQETQQRLKFPHRVRRATCWNQAKIPERRAGPKHNTQMVA